jgi:hypothetical protein
MKTLRIFVLLVLISNIAPAQSSTENVKTALPDTFQKVLDLAKMTFAIPKDAISIPVVKNRQMHYEYAITFQNQPFEVRYSVGPMGYTMTEAYAGGKGITPQIEPKLNNEFGARILSTTVALNVAGGTETQGMGSNPFPPEALKKNLVQIGVRPQLSR